jgi:hypothetical protein
VPWTCWPPRRDPFGLLDARGSLRIVTDAVHEDDALCLALSWRPLRDALWARFTAIGKRLRTRVVDKRLRTRDGAAAKLEARLTADVLLDLSGDRWQADSLTVLPEGIGRLAYLPRPGLKWLDVSCNRRLDVLSEGLCSLAGLEELNVSNCGVTALPAGIGALTALQKLDLSYN